MRTFFVIGLSLLSFTGIAQKNLTTEPSLPSYTNEDVPKGSISGTVRTADGSAAAFVTVRIRENGRTIFTDEQGFFSLTNIKEGVYTLEVSLVGLKPARQTVQVAKDGTATIDITLLEDIKQLNDVVIATGRRLNRGPVAIGKIDIHPMDLPQSITVVGSGLIRDQQAQRLSDVIRNVNGVYLSTTRGATQESLSARGYSFGGNNLFKNGARINSGAMPEMSGVERVEVLKGSAAILFGQVAPGGILNLVTKAPKFATGGEVSMRIGSYGLFKPAFDVYGPISEKLAFRVNGTFEKANSYRNSVESERWYVNPSLLLKLGKSSELQLEGDYLQHDFTPDFGIGTLGGTSIAPVARGAFFGTPWQYAKTKQATTTATFRQGLGEQWKLNSSISYQQYSRDYFSTERLAAAANGDWTRTLGRIDTEEDYYTAQVNFNGRFRTAVLQHQLLLGVDGDHYLTTNNDFTFPAANGLPAGSYDRINILDPNKFVSRTDLPAVNRIRERNAPVYRFGVYAQDLIRISDKWNLLAGLRYSWIGTKGIDSTNLLTGAKTKGKDREDAAFSPRLGLVYKPTGTTSLFLSYSNSFVVNTGQDLDGNTLEPSIIDQYEAGVKNDFFEGKLSANLTLYRIVNSNLAQTAPFLKDGVTQNNNNSIRILSGQTRSEGVEVDLAAHPLKGLDLTAGYSYNNMRYTKTDTTAGSFREGERLVGTPAHTANATAFYTFTSGMVKGLRLGATAVYIGERWAGWNSDVVKRAGAPFTYRERKFLVEGFTTIDLTAGYSFKKFSVLGKVSNLTNAMNWYVHENYSVNPIPPTQYIATLTYKF